MSWENDESVWLEGLGAGDADAFSALYEHYAQKCIRFVLAMTADEEAAKDITHEVFIKVWKYRGSISKVDSFNSYLFRMVKNAVLDIYERKSVKQRFVEQQLMTAEECRDMVDENVNSHDLRMLVGKALTDMPVQRRTVFLMNRSKGMSNQEIADSLGLSVRTVEKHISNALNDIRNVLKDNFVLFLVLTYVFAPTLESFL